MATATDQRAAFVGEFVNLSATASALASVESVLGPAIAPVQVPTLQIEDELSRVLWPSDAALDTGEASLARDRATLRAARILLELAEEADELRSEGLRLLSLVEGRIGSTAELAEARDAR